MGDTLSLHVCHTWNRTSSFLPSCCITSGHKASIIIFLHTQYVLDTFFELRLDVHRYQSCCIFTVNCTWAGFTFEIKIKFTAT